MTTPATLAALVALRSALSDFAHVARDDKNLTGHIAAVDAALKLAENAARPLSRHR